jgi:hypothetical protein
VHAAIIARAATRSGQISARRANDRPAALAQTGAMISKPPSNPPIDTSAMALAEASLRKVI